MHVSEMQNSCCTLQCDYSNRLIYTKKNQAFLFGGYRFNRGLLILVVEKLLLNYCFVHIKKMLSELGLSINIFPLVNIFTLKIMDSRVTFPLDW